MPAPPGLEHLLRVAALGQDAGEGGQVLAFLPGRTVLSLAEHALERRRELGQLDLERFVPWGGQGEGELEEGQLAADVVGEVEAVVLHRLDGVLHRGRDQGLVGLGRDPLRVFGNVGGLHPGGPLLAVAELEEALLRLQGEGPSLIRGGPPGGRSTSRHSERRRRQGQEQEPSLHRTSLKPRMPKGHDSRSDPPRAPSGSLAGPKRYDSWPSGGPWPSERRTRWAAW